MPQECQKDRLHLTGMSKLDTTGTPKGQTGHHMKVKRTDWTPHEYQKDRLGTTGMLKRTDWTPHACQKDGLDTT